MSSAGSLPFVEAWKEGTEIGKTDAGCGWKPGYGDIIDAAQSLSSMWLAEMGVKGRKFDVKDQLALSVVYQNAYVVSYLATEE